jgi:DNA-binding LacI/PurR family transcriptional regulator
MWKNSSGGFMEDLASDLSPKRNESQPGKIASIRDIARLANVSDSTVSRALRDSPLVKAETREKIRRIAEGSGYRASAVARSLATRRTRTIGVVVTTIADPFAAEVVCGIEEAAGELGYSLLLANSQADPCREAKVVTSFGERRVDGVVVTSSRVGTLYAGTLATLRVPIVLINGQHPSEDVHWVVIANAEASREATRHLIQLGHQRIAYLGDRHGYQSDTERFGGYRQALDEAGLPFEPDLVVYGDGKPEGGVQAVESLLALPKPPTAVFCFNDFSAVGALRRIHASGLRVPDDISLVGFDDINIAQYAEPPLTTVRQPKAHMGRLAFEILVKLLAGSDSEHCIKVPGELIVRESTAPPPAPH